MQTYSDPTRADDHHALPDVEVWHTDDYGEYVDDAFACPGNCGNRISSRDFEMGYQCGDCTQHCVERGIDPIVNANVNHDEVARLDRLHREGSALEEGWYYWPCFPGCLPDGDPVGPFACEAEAKAMAESDALDYCEDETDGPAPQDIVITDIPRGGWSVGEVEGEYVGTFTELADVEAAIKAKMEADKFWPNVWIVSDHGNVSLYQMDR